MRLFRIKTAPGRGLSEEEAKKRSYFGILWRKLTAIMRAGILFSLSNILHLSAFIFLMITAFGSSDAKEAMEIKAYTDAILSGQRLIPFYVFIPIMLLGPTMTGVTYLCRNFAKQEPCFIWSDFWESVEINIKQSLIAGAIIGIAYYIAINTAIVYLNSDLGGVLALILIVNIFIILTITAFYVYAIMVTYDMKLIKIFKYAFLLSLINLPQNISALASVVIVNLIFMGTMQLYFWILFNTVFLTGWTMYTINYATWTGIDRFMIKKE